MRVASRRSARHRRGTWGCAAELGATRRCLFVPSNQTLCSEGERSVTALSLPNGTGTAQPAACPVGAVAAGTAGAERRPRPRGDNASSERRMSASSGAAPPAGGAAGGHRQRRGGSWAGNAARVRASAEHYGARSRLPAPSEPWPSAAPSRRRSAGSAAGSGGRGRRGGTAAPRPSGSARRPGPGAARRGPAGQAGQGRLRGRAGGRGSPDKGVGGGGVRAVPLPRGVNRTERFERGRGTEPPAAGAPSARTMGPARRYGPLCARGGGPAASGSASRRCVRCLSVSEGIFIEKSPRSFPGPSGSDGVRGSVPGGHLPSPGRWRRGQQRRLCRVCVVKQRLRELRPN